MQTALTVPEIKAYQSRNLDAELKFCRSALARGNSLAMQGQLESATRDVWVIEDTADAVKSVLAKIEDIQRFDRLKIQLAAVQKGLKDLKRCLDIPSQND